MRNLLQLSAVAIVMSALVSCGSESKETTSETADSVKIAPHGPLMGMKGFNEVNFFTDEFGLYVSDLEAAGGLLMANKKEEGGDCVHTYKRLQDTVSKRSLYISIADCYDMGGRQDQILLENGEPVQARAMFKEMDGKNTGYMLREYVVMNKEGKTVTMSREKHITGTDKIDLSEIPLKPTTDTVITFSDSRRMAREMDNYVEGKVTGQ